MSMKRTKAPAEPKGPDREHIAELVKAVIARRKFNQHDDDAAAELHAISGPLSFMFARRLKFGPFITPQAREELVTSYMISAQRAAGEHPDIPPGFSDYTPEVPELANRAARRMMGLRAPKTAG